MEESPWQLWLRHYLLGRSHLHTPHSHHQNKAPQVSTDAANVPQAPVSAHDQWVPLLWTCDIRVHHDRRPAHRMTAWKSEIKGSPPWESKLFHYSHFLVILPIPRIADWETALNIWAFGGLPKPQHWPWRKAGNVLAQNLNMYIQPIYSMKLMKTIHPTLFQKYYHIPIYSP